MTASFFCLFPKLMYTQRQRNKFKISVSDKRDTALKPSRVQRSPNYFPLSFHSFSFTAAVSSYISEKAGVRRCFNVIDRSWTTDDDDDDDAVNN